MSKVFYNPRNSCIVNSKGETLFSPALVTERLCVGINQFIVNVSIDLYGESIALPDMFELEVYKTVHKHTGLVHVNDNGFILLSGIDVMSKVKNINSHQDYDTISTFSIRDPIVRVPRALSITIELMLELYKEA